MPPNPAKSAVFLDRDDTLIHCTDITPDGDLGDPALVRLLPGASQAVERLSEAGFAIVVVTNQGGVARGRYAPEDVEAVHERLNALLEGRVEAFRFCPYHPEGTLPAFTCEHPWRKPAPGMILDAAAALEIDLAGSWLVGDKPGTVKLDVGPAAARSWSILIAWKFHPAEGHPEVDFTALDLASAADIILSSHL